MVNLKRCTVCSMDKPTSAFRKYSGRSADGLRPLCKDCQRAYEKKWRSNSAESRKTYRNTRKESAAIYARAWRVKNRAFYLIAECRRRSANKGLAFDLDTHIEEISDRIAKGYCEVSGIPLSNSAEPGRAFNTVSLDRKDPTRGYTLENVRVVAFCVNAMLGNWGEDVALNVFSQWLENRSKNDSLL